MKCTIYRSNNLKFCIDVLLYYLTLLYYSHKERNKRLQKRSQVTIEGLNFAMKCNAIKNER